MNIQKVNSTEEILRKTYRILISGRAKEIISANPYIKQYAIDNKSTVETEFKKLLYSNYIIFNKKHIELDTEVLDIDYKQIYSDIFFYYLLKKIYNRSLFLYIIRSLFIDYSIFEDDEIKTNFTYNLRKLINDDKAQSILMLEPEIIDKLDYIYNEYINPMTELKKLKSIDFPAKRIISRYLS